jgi:hypothetical protein
MLYSAFEMQRTMLTGTSALAHLGAQWMQHPINPMAHLGVGPIFASGFDVIAHASAPRGKPEFGLHTDAGERRPPRRGDRGDRARRSRSATSSTSAAKGVEGDPKLLIVAPMSGHYATLLRGTVERMLPGHDVYITDWRDAKLVPLSAGRFDLDDYVDYLIEFLETIGADTHVLAVCPADRAGLCRDRGDVRGRQSGAAADAHHDGRPDRHARGADRGQHRRHPAPAQPGSNRMSSRPCPSIIRAPGGGSIRASCSWPASWR